MPLAGESCRTDACRQVSDGPQDIGLTTVWKELGVDNAYWMAAHHYVFTLILIACFAALWWQYRQAVAELDRYRGKGE